MKNLLLHSIRVAILFTGLATCSDLNAGALPDDGFVADIQAILVAGAPSVEAVDIAQVEIKRVADGQLEPGRVGLRLLPGDEIKTGSGVEVSLVFTKPDSEDRIEVFVLDNSKASIGSLFSFYGRFWIGGWGVFDTRTHYTRLGKRGTEFWIDVSEEGYLDLTVLVGEVEIEQKNSSGSGNGDAPSDEQPRFINAAAGTSREKSAQATTVTGLHKIRVEKDKPLEKQKPLQKPEVLSVVDKTNDLYLATVPSRLPSNVWPTTYALADDPAANKKAADETFKKARLAAVVQPDAKNTARLAEVYKDLGAGERSVVEFRRAEKLEPALATDPNFLAGQSEAYRMSGNLAKSHQLIAAATRYSASADLKTTRAVKVASGNLYYDQAVASVGRKDVNSANSFFLKSKAAYEDAGPTITISEGNKKFNPVRYNIENVKLAINGLDPTVAVRTGLDGTYRGTIEFPAFGLTGQATLVITGRRFSILHCQRSLEGTIVPGAKSPTGRQYDFVFETNGPVDRITLNFNGSSTSRVVTNVATENRRFSFTQVASQSGMMCIDQNRIPRKMYVEKLKVIPPSH